MEPILNPLQPMQSVARTPEEKLRRRRVRRWKRRARIAGPFVGVTVLLAALSLSVDLIEYQPRESPERLSDRPIHFDAPAKKEPTAHRRAYTRTTGASVVVTGGEPDLDADLLSLDLTLPSTRVARVPTPPEAVR